MLTTEPSKGQTLTLCQIIKYSNTTKENKELAKELARRWYRRGNIETVTRIT
tara:strand:+ start:1151 stop:1306 length:156 start_codon:yes stop_codon:yes gene_type:complete